jgi:Lhr-like helicase
MTTLDINKVREVYELKEAGHYIPTIARKALVPERVARRWIDNPSIYSPYFDEIALDRALNGDKSAFDQLSLFEVDEFWKRADQRTAEAQTEPGIPYNPYNTLLQAMLGMTPKRLNVVRRQYQVARTATPVTRLKFARLNEESVRGIRDAAAAGEPQRSIAARYGVGRSTVQSIVGRHSWAHVE